MAKYRMGLTPPWLLQSLHSHPLSYKVSPGTGLVERGVSRAAGNTLHEPCEVSTKIAHGLAPLGIHLHFAGAHAIYHIPVERADERLVIVGDVFVEPVQRGGSAAAARYSDGGAGLVGQFAAGGVVQAVQQGTERAVRPGKVGGAAEDDGAGFVQLVVNGVVQLISYAAAASFEAAAPADAALYGFCTKLDDFCLRAARAEPLCHHTEGVESVAGRVRTTIDEKRFHTPEVTI